ncbi:MAG: hypothetical protein ACI9F9_000655 [Candidatus Paceibacteria bacterium]|jgi:hypothetical protein
MKRSAQTSQSFLLALCCALLLALPSCKTNGDQWSFAVSREAYGGGEYPGSVDFGGGCGGGGEAAAVVLLVILLLPLAVDIVFLPVAATHDLCN